MRFAGVGVLENVQALRVGRHQTVLDAVVNHLDEMAGAGGAAVKIALFGGATYFVASGSARNVATAGRQRFENRIEALYHVGFAADHLAIAALKAPDAAARSHIAIVNAFGGEFLRAANVVDVIRITSINDHVVLFELAHQIVRRGIHYGCGNHEPDRARSLELLDKIVERSRAGRTFTF